MNTKTSSRIRLVASDLDGTLLNSENRVSRENLRAIRDLQERGIEVVLASGRHYNSMRQIAVQLPGVRWLVSAQGGELASLGRDMILFRSFLPASKVLALTELCGKMNLVMAAYTPDGVLSNSSKADRFLGLFGEDSLVYSEQDELLREDIFKIVVVGDSQKIASLGTEKVFASLGVQALQTHENIFEFMPMEASKGRALAVLSRYLQIHPEEVAVFGDGENDVSMFDWAGVSVAMPKSWPLAHARAKYIAPDSPQDIAFSCAVDKLLGWAVF